MARGVLLMPGTRILVGPGVCVVFVVCGLLWLAVSGPFFVVCVLVLKWL